MTCACAGICHLPLATGVFDDAGYEGFISGKEAMWRESGYSPWAFFIDDCYAGWGGLLDTAE